MLIPVIYPSGSHDLVKDFYLDYLIAEEKIEQFKRSDGWISIDSPNIRGKRTKQRYAGPERRQISSEEDNLASEIEFYKP